MVPEVEQQIKKVFNWKRNVAMDRKKLKKPELRGSKIVHHENHH